MLDIVDADKSWVQDLDFVMKYGYRTAPRGLPVNEVLGYKSTLSMFDPIIRNPVRKLGYKFMAAEAAWILSGDDRVETISPYSKDISRFSDDGVTFFGAYGPKIVQQLPYVLFALTSDNDSRQAVVNIWRENPPKARDIPCTLSLQWLVRQGHLHCVASMRSSDLWLGHPYDIFNFSAVSFALLLELNITRDNKGLEPVNLGNLYLTAGSKHVYERNFESVEKVVADWPVSGRERDSQTPFDSSKYSDSNEFVTALWDAAESERGVLTLLPGD